MTTKDNIATVRRFWAGFNAHNLDVWDEVCTPDFINHDPGLPTPEADLAAIKQTIGAMQAAERLAALELNTLVFECVVTDQRQRVAEELAQKRGAPVEHVLNSVHFLIGTVEQMTKEVQMWRERFGISYVAVFPNAMDAFAPVVAKLAGQ